MGTMSLPPGFRFHPTDDELVGYYLKRKCDSLKIELEVVPVIDLYKFEPWELPEKSFLPKRDLEWFFFCPRDRKYPNGSRTNRATTTGYWKATGKDRKIACGAAVFGVRKTLVFYKGRAPGGERTDWVMHEYRLCQDLLHGANNFLGPYALCRVIKRHEAGLNGEPAAKASAAAASGGNRVSSMRKVSSSSSLVSADNQLSGRSSASPPPVAPFARGAGYSSPSSFEDIFCGAGADAFQFPYGGGGETVFDVAAMHAQQNAFFAGDFLAASEPTPQASLFGDVMGTSVSEHELKWDDYLGCGGAAGGESWMMTSAAAAAPQPLLLCRQASDGVGGEDLSAWFAPDDNMSVY